MSKGRKRTESNNPKFKRALIEIHGDRCVNCGSEDSIEFHHIVPLSLGGTNSYGNIVPLCWRCHKAIHRGITIEDLKRDRPKSGGRKRKDSEFANVVFEKFIDGKIGSIKANELLGYKSNATRVNMRVQFKDYCKARGIKKVSNRIDLHGVTGRNGLYQGRWVGYIEYDNGEIRDIYYQDTGENDVDYVHRGS